jgi:TRAP-type transport system small permease protein
MTSPQPDRPRPNHATHWVWFVGIVGLLGLVGFGLSVFLMLPLAMATDSCHDGSTDDVCTLTAAGQNVLVMIPWVCLCAGTAAAVVGAGIAAYFRKTPLLGLPIGIAVYFAMIPAGYWLAFHV